MIEIKESDLQAKCNKYLRDNNVLYYHQEKGRGGKMQKYMRNGGMPDLYIFMKSGHCFFVELKIPGGKLEQEQAEAIGKLTDNGYAVYITDNFEEFKKIIQIELDKIKKLCYN